MTVEAYAVFTATLSIVQISLGIIVGRETATWKRVAGALFILNGIANFPTSITGVITTAWDPYVAAADLTTSPLIVLLALVYPTERGGSRRTRALVAAAILVAVAGAFTAIFLPRIDRYLFVWIITFVGYAIFLGSALPRALSSPSLLEPGSEWVLAGFGVRMVEFVPRYAYSIFDLTRFGTENWIFALGACAWIVLAGASVFAAIAVFRALRTPELRLSAQLVGLSLVAGFVLGLAQNPFFLPPVQSSTAPISPGSSAQTAFIFISTVSLVIVRPLLVSIGILGPRYVASFLAPVGLAAAFGILALYGLPAVLGGGYPPSVVALVASSAALIGVVLGLPIARQARSGEGTPDASASETSADSSGPPRWSRLVLALEGSSREPRKPEDRWSRQGLAAELGVSARNLHRYAEQANTTGASILGLAQGTALVSWSLLRGKGGRLRYFYRLTREGEASLGTVRATVLRTEETLRSE
ncbi:MAG: hypothetical protein ACYDCK_04580 [Thermoplasmatota archaeon]